MSGPHELDAALLAARMRMAKVLASRQKAMAAMPEKFCNSTTTGLYTGPAWSQARPDGDDFLLIQRRGF